MRYFLLCTGLLVGIVTSSLVGAEQNPVVVKRGEQPAVVNTAFKASTLMGMAVKNLRDEKVGSVADFVVDTPSGHIRYAAVSVGGFLGIGDKLFAVPWKSMVLKHDSTGAFFVLDVTKERMKNAPGFEKNHWPDFGDPKFGTEIDKFYGVTHEETASTK